MYPPKTNLSGYQASLHEGGQSDNNNRLDFRRYHLPGRISRGIARRVLANRNGHTVPFPWLV